MTEPIESPDEGGQAGVQLSPQQLERVAVEIGALLEVYVSPEDCTEVASLVVSALPKDGLESAPSRVALRDG